MSNTKTLAPWKENIREIIFEADTPAGKAFDITLLLAIIASVLAVMLETVTPIQEKYGNLFLILEWVFTIFFTIEYVLRIICVLKPMRYVTSFYGIVDLLAIIPTYLSLFVVGTHYLLVIRALRLLRVFRIFKLAHFLNEGSQLANALKASRAKITIFLLSVLMIVIIIGSFIYLIEGGEGTQFVSIPISIYWAIVTLTTVGYGDISPVTPVGQFFAGIVMLLGYAIIAVPTGIVSAEIQAAKKEEEVTTRACKSCGEEGHDTNAVYCKFCGEAL